jgi:hypothetical protein
MPTDLPTELALAAYRTVLAGPRPAPVEDPDRPAAIEDRGSLLDLLVGPRCAVARAPAHPPAWLAGLSRTSCLPLTAASGC